jgi:protein involved in polysaccharide export with SLBB domain
LKKKLHVILLTSLVVFLNFVFTPGFGYGEMIPPGKISVSAPAVSETSPALENSIDPAEYMLGAGDELSIDIWGETNVHHTLAVTPEGDLLIPGVGRVSVSGISLAEAKNTVQNAILQSYKNVPITVSLVKLKKVKVVVAGRVRSPGVYTVFANTRVSEVVDTAGILPDTSSLRNIMITHPDGNTLPVDIFKFTRVGNRCRNPYVLGGDVVFVPSREEFINTVGIYGAV